MGTNILLPNRKAGRNIFHVLRLPPFTAASETAQIKWMISELERLFENGRNAGLAQIFVLSKAFWCRNPAGFKPNQRSLSAKKCVKTAF